MGGEFVVAVDDGPLRVGEIGLAAAAQVTGALAQLFPHLGRECLARGAGGRVILVPELVAETVFWIELRLQREKLWRARIGLEELLLRRMRLVGQVIRAPYAQHRVDELPGPDPHLFARLDVGLLLVVEDEREHLVARPGEQRAWILVRAADRHAARIDTVRAQNLAHLPDEFAEALDRDEILLQPAGRSLARRGLQL